MATRAPSWARNGPMPMQTPTRSNTGASGYPANYMSAVTPPTRSGLPVASAQHLGTAQQLPWAGAAAAVASTTDQLAKSQRQMPNTQPKQQPPQAPPSRKAAGPTLGQVAGLGGSSWQGPRGPAAMPRAVPQAAATQGVSSTATPKKPEQSWVPDAAAVAPKGSAPTLGFDWAAGGFDFLSKTAPTMPSSGVGNLLSSAVGGFNFSASEDGVSKNALSSTMATFNFPAAEEKNAKVPERAVSPAPVRALNTLAAAPIAAVPQPRPPREGCFLRFNTGTSSRQHPAKQAQRIPNADATEESPMLLGICDGVSGCTKLGISPDMLPHEILSACRSKCKQWAPLASKGDTGQWLIELLKDAYTSTSALGATTVLLATIINNTSLMTANIGDCGLVVLRVIPAGSQGSARLQVIFRTKPTRYDASKPVQVQRLPNMPEERTHNVIMGTKLDACTVQSGDYVVMGSDGLFDNLQDEDILKLLERHCPLDRAAPTTALNEAAAALVSTAIAQAKPANKNSARQHDAAEDKGNPDDTTALVAAVVEVPDVEEFERWFWRSRGLPQPCAEPQRQGPPRQEPPRNNMRNNSVPRSSRPQALNAVPETALQDCTNMQMGSAEASACPGQAQDNMAMRPISPNGDQQMVGNRGQIFQGKGAGKHAQAQPSQGAGGLAAPGAPNWWTKMAVPGQAAPTGTTFAAKAAPQRPQNTQSAEEQATELHNQRLTSCVLRAHEVKMATAESIARYGSASHAMAARNNPMYTSAPQFRQQQPMRIVGNDQNCVIS